MYGAALSIVMLLYLWGSCIAYLVIIGDSFSPLLKMALGESYLALPPPLFCVTEKLLRNLRMGD